MWLSVPLYWLQQSVPGPIPASTDSAWGAVTLGEVTIHLLRGGKMLACPGKKLIFPVQQLDKQGFVQAGLRVRLLHCSQNRTGFCAEKFDVEVKHHCSILADPLILCFEMVSLVSHQKWNRASLWFYRSGSWDEWHFSGWSSTAAENLLLFKSFIFWCDSGTSQRKRALFKRNTPNQKAMFLKKHAFSAHVNLPITSLCFSCRLQYHVQSRSSWAEPVEIATGKCQELLHWHHWDFCHWFQ